MSKIVHLDPGGRTNGEAGRIQPINKEHMMWPIIPDPINLVVATMHAIWPWLPTVTIVLRLITAFITLLVNVHHAIHEWRK